MTELIVAAEDASAELYVKAEAGDDGTPLVLLAVAFGPAGEFAFVGECYAERVAAPLVDRFGEDTAAVVRSLVGADAARTQDVLGG